MMKKRKQLKYLFENINDPRNGISIFHNQTFFKVFKEVCSIIGVSSVIPPRKKQEFFTSNYFNQEHANQNLENIYKIEIASFYNEILIRYGEELGLPENVIAVSQAVRHIVRYYRLPDAESFRDLMVGQLSLFEVFDKGNEIKESILVALAISSVNIISYLTDVIFILGEDNKNAIIDFFKRKWKLDSRCVISGANGYFKTGRCYIVNDSGQLKYSGIRKKTKITIL